VQLRIAHTGTTSARHARRSNTHRYRGGARAARDSARAAARHQHGIAHGVEKYGWPLGGVMAARISQHHLRAARRLREQLRAPRTRGRQKSGCALHQLAIGSYQRVPTESASAEAAGVEALLRRNILREIYHQKTSAKMKSAAKTRGVAGENKMKKSEENIINGGVAREEKKWLSGSGSRKRGGRKHRRLARK